MVNYSTPDFLGGSPCRSKFAAKNQCAYGAPLQNNHLVQLNVSYKIANIE